MGVPWVLERYWGKEGGGYIDLIWSDSIATSYSLAESNKPCESYEGLAELERCEIWLSAKSGRTLTLICGKRGGWLTLYILAVEAKRAMS